MKIADIRAVYYEASASVSDICRQACFAGIAIVWIFQEGKQPHLESDLLWPLSYLVLSLGFDLFQYIFKTGLWGFYARLREDRVNRGRTTDADRKVPPWFNAPHLVFFWTKVGACVMGYVLIFSLIYCRLV